MDTVWIKKATHVSDFKIELEFNDGKRGLVDLEKQLSQPIFEPLREKNTSKILSSTHGLLSGKMGLILPLNSYIG